MSEVQDKVNQIREWMENNGRRPSSLSKDSNEAKLAKLLKSYLSPTKTVYQQELKSFADKNFPPKGVYKDYVAVFSYNEPETGEPTVVALSQPGDILNLIEDLVKHKDGFIVKAEQTLTENLKNEEIMKKFKNGDYVEYVGKDPWKLEKFGPLPIRGHIVDHGCRKSNYYHLKELSFGFGAVESDFVLVNAEKANVDEEVDKILKEVKEKALDGETHVRVTIKDDSVTERMIDLGFKAKKHIVKPCVRPITEFHWHFDGLDIHLMAQKDDLQFLLGHGFTLEGEHIHDGEEIVELVYSHPK